MQKELANRKAKIKMDRVSAMSPFQNMIDGCWPGRLSQGDLKKEQANRKAKIKMDRVSAKSPFKNMIGGCWPGRLSQRDLKKRASDPKAPNNDVAGVW